jgi:hypothetical protein
VNDDFSKKICDRCLEILTNAHKLRETSIRCDSFLKFNNTTVHVVQVIKNENGGLVVVAKAKAECYVVKEEKLEETVIQKDVYENVYRLPEASLIIQEPLKSEHHHFIPTPTFAISTAYETLMMNNLSDDDGDVQLLDSSDSDDEMMLSNRILKEKSRNFQQKSFKNNREKLYRSQAEKKAQTQRRIGKLQAVEDHKAMMKEMRKENLKKMKRRSNYGKEIKSCGIRRSTCVKTKH